MTSSSFKGYGRASVLPRAGSESTSLEWKRGYFLHHFGAYLPADRDAEIADVAFGFGPYLRTLKDLGYRRLHGVDLGEEQVDYARAVLGLDGVSQGDAIEWLERHGGRFDCILLFDILEHLPLEDLLRIGRAAHDALRPGGRVIVHVPNGLAPLAPVLHADITHQRAFTVQSLRQFFAASGLEPEAFIELTAFPHGVKSRVQRMLWRILFAPLIRGFVLLAYGRIEGGIHTINLAATARRPT